MARQGSWDCCVAGKEHPLASAEPAAVCLEGKGGDSMLLPGAVVPWRPFCLVPGHTAGCTLRCLTLTGAALMGHCSLED